MGFYASGVTIGALRNDGKKGKLSHRHGFCKIFYLIRATTGAPLRRNRNLHR